MKLDGKVNLARLFERTSAKGNRYFSGRMGAKTSAPFAQQLAKPVSGPENADTGPSLPFGEPLQ